MCIQEGDVHNTVVLLFSSLISFLTVLIFQVIPVSQYYCSQINFPITHKFMFQLIYLLVKIFSFLSFLFSLFLYGICLSFLILPCSSNWVDLALEQLLHLVLLALYYGLSCELTLNNLLIYIWERFGLLLGEERNKHVHLSTSKTIN